MADSNKLVSLNSILEYTREHLPSDAQALDKIYVPSSIANVSLGSARGSIASVEFWRGFDNDYYGDYMGLGAQSADGTDGFRIYLGSDRCAMRTFVGATGSTYLWDFDPTLLVKPYQNETVSLAASSSAPWITYGYFGAAGSSGPTMYMVCSLPKPIKNGQEISNVSITGDFRCPGGLVNGSSSQTPTVASGGALRAINGDLRLAFTPASFTSNNTPQTPVVIYIRSLSFTVATPSN